jgi:parallel beta-helix repeat protein
MKLSSVVAVVLIVFLSTAGHTRTWRVNQEGTGDAPTIPAAVDSSAAMDTILVAPGTYVQQFIFLISNLTLLSEGGADETFLHTSGSWILSTGSDCVIRGFTIEGASGTAFIVSMTRNIIIENNVFRNNSCAICADFMSSNIIIRNNLIYANGRGIYMWDASGGAEISYNTIAYNEYALSTDDPSGDLIHHNIICHNGVGIDGFGPMQFQCNDIFDNDEERMTLPTGTDGNIAVDPQFCAVDPPGSGNFLIQSDSPCAPGNHPDAYACGLIGACPVGCQDVSVEKSSWGAIKAIYK